MPDAPRAVQAQRSAQERLLTVNREIAELETQRGANLQELIGQADALTRQLREQRDALSGFAQRGALRDINEQLRTQARERNRLVTLQQRQVDLTLEVQRAERSEVRQLPGANLPARQRRGFGRPDERESQSGLLQGLRQIAQATGVLAAREQARASFRLQSIQAERRAVAEQQEAERQEITRTNILAINAIFERVQARREADRGPSPQFRLTAEEGRGRSLRSQLDQQTDVAGFDEVARELRRSLTTQSQIRQQFAENDSAAQLAIRIQLNEQLNDIDQQRFDLISGLSDQAFQNLSEQNRSALSEYQNAIRAYNQIQRQASASAEREIIASNRRIARSVSSTVTSLLGQLVQGQVTFKNFVRSVLASLAQLVVREALFRVVLSLFGPRPGSQQQAPQASVIPGGGSISGLVRNSFHLPQNDRLAHQAAFRTARQELLASPRAFGVQSARDLVENTQEGIREGLRSAGQGEQGGERMINLNLNLDIGGTSIGRIVDAIVREQDSGSAIRFTV